LLYAAGGVFAPLLGILCGRQIRNSSDREIYGVFFLTRLIYIFSSFCSVSGVSAVALIWVGGTFVYDRKDISGTKIKPKNTKNY
jgi:hypothetical protein